MNTLIKKIKLSVELGELHPIFYAGRRVEFGQFLR